MNTNEVINCVREHLDKWYASDNHNETAIQLVNEYEERIMADERAKFAKEIKDELEYAYHANVSKKRLRRILLDMLEKEQKNDKNNNQL